MTVAFKLSLRQMAALTMVTISSLAETGSGVVLGPGQGLQT